MGKISKTFALFLTLIMVTSSLILFDWIPLGLAQNGTNVSGIIRTNTTWAAGNSPYILTGNVLVDNGVTLTIEAGATVNFVGYYMEINGTLVAKGTSTNPISISGGVFGVGDFIFTQYSKSWDESTASGSIIEYVNHFSANITNSSPKITNNLNGLIGINGGAPIISNNKGGQIDVYDGSPIISGNSLSFLNGWGQINIYGGSPIISNNNISGSYQMINGDFMSFVPEFGILINGNNVNAQISNNIIVGHSVAGINAISGKATIIRNLIFNNTQNGIADQPFHQDQVVVNVELIIHNNTISNSQNGISNTYSSASVIISENNFRNNSYNLYLGSTASNSGNPNDVNAQNNWWGTSNEQAIKQTLYDFNKDFNLGKVNYTPFLTALNPQAPDLNSLPTPSPSPSFSAPSPSPTVPEFPSWTISLLSMIMITCGLSVYFKKYTHKKCELR